jgi:hypothetical protein
LSGLL